MNLRKEGEEEEELIHDIWMCYSWDIDNEEYGRLKEDWKKKEKENTKNC